jgi:DNA-binding MarR family transcriptional regulator
VPDTDDLADVLRAATTRLTRRLRAEAGQSDYSDAQIAVLRRLLTEGPRSASALARAEGVRPQSMAATVTALEEAGIVDRRRDPDDRRATRVEVTEAGRAAIEAGRERKHDWLDGAIRARLTDDERTTLRAAAVLIERLLDARP